MEWFPNYSADVHKCIVHFYFLELQKSETVEHDLCFAKDWNLTHLNDRIIEIVK